MIHNRFIGVIYVISVAFSMLFYSCRNRTSSESAEMKADSITTIHPQFSDSRYISSIIDSISYVGIDTDGKKPLRNIDKITKIGSDFIILDSRCSQIIVVDEQSGKCRFAIDCIGQGPEEYLEIRAFCADDSVIYIVDNVRARMMQFSLSDGKFIRSSAMPVTADDAEILDDGGFVFACVPLGSQRKLLPSCHRLFVTDHDLNVIRSIFPYAENEHDLIGQRFYLSRNGSEIIFGSLMTRGFSILTEKELKQIKNIDIAFDRPVSRNTTLDDLNNHQYLIQPPYGAGKYYYLTMKDGNGRLKYGIWDSAENILMANDRTEGKAIGHIIGSYDNCMMSLIQSREFYDELVDHSFPKAQDNVEKLLDNDDYALIVYHLK